LNDNIAVTNDDAEHAYAYYLLFQVPVNKAQFRPYEDLLLLNQGIKDQYTREA
jgi:hypothetical protein